MTARTLVLTPWYFPFTIVDWKTAVTLLYLRKAEVVSSYDDEIRSVSMTLRRPAVIRLRKPVSAPQRGAEFSRANLHDRDNLTSGYCECNPALSHQLYGHAIPRARGGRTLWTNILAWCHSPGAQQGPRTPAARGRSAVRSPFQPLPLPLDPPLVDPQLSRGA